MDISRPWPRSMTARTILADCLFLPGLLAKAASILSLSNDQAALFGKRDEIAGRDEAAQRMHPARQRLEAGDLAGGNRGTGGGLRLVVQRQLAVLDRDRKILVQHAAVADLLVHLRLEHADG